MGRLITIVGPTAVGKSDLALEVAQHLQGEVVNADSRQVYRFMDIGTSKPSPQERRLVPHHLIDIVDPDQDFSLALYQRLAYQVIGEILKRGKLPLLVGGTGLYIWAVVEGWQIAEVPPDWEFRQRLERLAAEKGTLTLYQELQRLDPEAAARIHPRNVRRLIRALEVISRTGHPLSQLQRKGPPPFEVLILGLTMERQALYARIDARVETMIERGWVGEVEKLRAMGYALSLPALSGLGYRQIGLFLEGKLDLPTAVQRIKHETHRFARHQYAWFRPRDERIRWLEAGPGVTAQALSLVKDWLGPSR
ncbi:MAG TPA: tRNA (adenosine(37)-N6)-dimethylallyltransferase MiaA [Dehalococcoidia bacterium]|nr:tRNA (adenosine(37)-N6)-dimethylallyltransferase MiaA [Dehalococcoidia bacterium]